MARQPKKKGPGTGRPGVSRKYAKDAPKRPAKPKADDDQALKDAMQSLRGDQEDSQAHHQPQDPQDLEIDFSAPLAEPQNSENPNSPLIDNNIYINNKGISRKVLNRRENINIVDSNNPPNSNHQETKQIDDCKVLIPEIVEDNDFSLKAQLTVKELRFIELCLSGDYTREKAMKLAGYNGYNERYLYELASKIVQKYELQAGDHRKIMRAMGYGEVKILELLIDSATNAKSETVKLNARLGLARCLGMAKETIEGVEGITIVFNKPPDQPPGPGQAPPTAPQTPTKVRMIK